jgi:hypothetical protein
MEVFSGPGLGKTNGVRCTERMDSEYLGMLKLGIRVAPSGNQDNHYRTWGTLTDVRTGVLARELTESAILEAIRERRVFASEDKNLEICFTAESRPMGSEIPLAQCPALGESIDLRVRLYDPDEVQSVYNVSVFSGIEGEAAASCRKTVSCRANDERHADWRIGGVRFEGAGQFVLLRIEQVSEGFMPDIVWTAPVWFGEPRRHDDDLQLVELAPPADDRSPNGQYIVVRNGGAQPVSAAGWQVLDRAGNSFDLGSLLVAPGATERFEGLLGGLWINHDGDAIVLVAPDGRRVQTIVFGPLESGQPVVTAPWK